MKVTRKMLRGSIKRALNGTTERRIRKLLMEQLEPYVSTDDVHTASKAEFLRLVRDRIDDDLKPKGSTITVIGRKE